MGAHYQSIHFRTTDAAAVQAWLTQACTTTKLRLWVAPPDERWITAFPSDMLLAEKLCPPASQGLSCDVLHTMLHDSDLFAYTLYRGGQIIDEFCSDPDYFKPVSPAERQRLAGQPEKLAALVTTPDGVERLRSLLRDPDDIGPETTMQLFMDELGITQFLSDYRYLEEGEHDTVTNWKKFVHVPDRAAEKVAARQERAQRKVNMKDWAATGALRFDRELAKAGQRLDNMRAFDPDPEGGGFFIMERFGNGPAQRWLPPAAPMPAPNTTWHPLRDVDFSIRHPTQPYCLKLDRGDLAVVDADSRRLLRRLRPTNPLLLARKRALWDAFGAKHIPDSLLDSETLMSGAFSPDGDLVFIGTKDGLRVYRSAEIFAAQEKLPTPIGGVDTTFAVDDYGHVHSLLVLPEAELVLYTCKDDAIRQYHWPTATAREFAPGFGGWSAFSLVRSGNGRLVACSMRECDKTGKLRDGFAIRVWDLSVLAARQVDNPTTPG